MKKIVMITDKESQQSKLKDSERAKHTFTFYSKTQDNKSQ